MKNVWKKTPSKAPIGREVIGREGTVSILKEPTVKTVRVTKPLTQQRGVSVKKGLTDIQKLSKHQFKTGLRKTELTQIKQGKYTDDITKLRSRVKKEMKLLEAKPKLDTAELELIKHNKEILKITEPKPKAKWAQEKPSYRQPTTSELKQMRVLSEAERGVHDLSSYWNKVRRGEISLSAPTGQGVTPWSGRGATTLTRPISRRVSAESFWGKRGVTQGRGELGSVGSARSGILGEVPKAGQLQGQGLTSGYTQAQETVPGLVYGEDIAEISDVVPVSAEEPITGIAEEQILKQGEIPSPYPSWAFTWQAPPPYQRIKEPVKEKEPPVKPGGLLLPGLGGGIGAGGGGRGAGYRPGGYKEHEYEVPNMWKATASTLGRWKKPSEAPRPSWAGASSTKKSKFFTIKK